MPNKNRVLATELATFAGSSLSTAFQVIDASGFAFPCFMLRIINDASLDITISYDGATSHDFIRTTETLQLPVQSNASPYSGIALFPKGMKIYVKSSASGTGIIYLAGYYQEI